MTPARRPETGVALFRVRGPALWLLQQETTRTLQLPTPKFQAELSLFVTQIFSSNQH